MFMDSGKFQKSMFKSESDQSHYMIPLMLDLSKSAVLVIGNGTVGQRKAAYFAGKAASLVIEDAVPENLGEAVSAFDFIIAATASAEENERICAVAAAQKKWYNSATEVGNFLIPAALFEDTFTLALSTNGKAPAAASFLRDYIRENLPAFSAMVSLQETLRAELKETVTEQPRRAEILEAILADESVWKALEAGDFAGALAVSRRYM